MEVVGLTDTCPEYASLVVSLPECPLPDVPGSEQDVDNPPHGTDLEIQTVSSRTLI